MVDLCIFLAISDFVWTFDAPIYHCGLQQQLTSYLLFFFCQTSCRNQGYTYIISGVSSKRQNLQILIEGLLSSDRQEIQIMMYMGNFLS
jgi:hypothetical protein